MARFIFLSLIVLVLGSSPAPIQECAAADVDDFLDVSTEDLPGRLYVPPEAANADSPRPLILFLHGAGETGTNNRSQINGNIDNLLSAAKDRGAFLYAPQATTVSGRIDNWSDEARTTRVMSVVDQLLAEQNVDPSRLYLTGLSMGGGGAWTMLSRYDDRFAATVPIAGVAAANDFEPLNLTDKPTWAFHARDDGTVSKENSRRVVNQILAAGGLPVIESFPANSDRETTFEFSAATMPLKYTEYPSGGHGIWPRVYATPEVYDWMFAHQVQVPEPTSGGLLLFAAAAVVNATRRARRARRKTS